MIRNLDNQQKNNNKQYCIPMAVNDGTIEDFDINPNDVQWTKIGNRKVRVIMIPVNKEQYYEYMRPLWREDKRQQRAEPMVSLDKLYDENECEIANGVNIEEDFEKKVLVEELHKALDELDDMDHTIMDLFSNGSTEYEIGRAIGMSQKGVNKRKHRILEKLKNRLKDSK